MKATTIFAKTALALALAGTMGAANAGLSFVGSFEDHLHLSVEWKLDAVPAGGSWTIAGPSLSYWNVGTLTATIDPSAAVGPFTVALDTASVGATHIDSGHEPGPGPTFSGAVITTWGATGADRKMAAHVSPSNWVYFDDTPAGWNSPQHWDHYELKISAANDGSASIYLKALHPVPEPETYAMLLAGLGVIGAIARRRTARIR